MPRRGRARETFASPHPPSILIAKFPKDPLFGIILTDPILAGQRQNFSKGVFDANINKFDGGARNVLVKLL